MPSEFCRSFVPRECVVRVRICGGGALKVQFVIDAHTQSDSDFARSNTKFSKCCDNVKCASSKQYQDNVKNYVLICVDIIGAIINRLSLMCDI
jgi:hypothetical protein